MNKEDKVPVRRELTFRLRRQIKHCRNKYVNGIMLNAAMEKDRDGPNLVWRPRVSQLTFGGRLESGFENGLKLLTTR